MTRPKGTPFRCPECDKPMVVIDTYIRQGALRRRRKCPDGHARINTKEVQVAA